jgi:glycosyltransferase involved in cell wall biosynthesis
MRFDHGLTISIPNWNHELLLPRAIQSGLRVVEQLRAAGDDGEVLVIDDHSRDGSVSLLRQLEARYYDAGLRVRALASNGGLAAARNQALAHANFRHIAFVDADNELISENIPVFLRALRETSAAAAYGNIFIRSVTSTTAYTGYNTTTFQDSMFENNYLDAMALFDRGQLVDELGYKDQRWEDYEMWLHLATNGRQILFVPLVLGYYYIVPTSMSLDPLENQNLKNLHARMKRVYDQMKARSHLPLTARNVRYHPDLGYF